VTERRPFALVGLFLLFVFAAGVVLAEDGVLVVHVTYLDKKPLAHVRIGTAGDGSIEVTDVGGRARIHLVQGVRAGQEVALQVVLGESDKDSWVFISPWDQRVLVPPFDGGQAVPVVLAKRSDKEALLGSSEGRKAIEQKLLSELGKLRQAQAEVTEEQRRSVLQAQAAAFGLNSEEVDAAIRAAGQESADLYEQGLAALYEKNYPIASERLKIALAASEKELGQVQEKVGDRAFFLGQSLYEQGRYQESVISFRRAAELRGEQAETLNRLGLALEAAGNYLEAEAVLNRTLNADLRTNSNLGPAIQANLAIVLKDRGDLTGARRLGEQVLESLRRQLGSDHLATLTAMGNLAETLRAQGDLPKARQLEEQVLESLRRQLGSDHLATLTAINNLAETLRAQGDLSKARQLEEQVLESRRRQLGADHPDTLTAINNLAETLRTQGDLPRARQLQEQVLESRRRQLGADHPDTLTAMGNLALMLRSQGDLPKARQLEEQVLDSLDCQFGADHLATLTAMSNLASTLRSQGNLPKARQFQEQVLESRRRQLGADHPDTLTAMNNLAVTLDAQGNLAAGRVLQEQVLKARRRILGPKHPSTSHIEWNLLLTLKDLDDQGGVRELEESLTWLLDADEAELPALQREIRQDLSEFQEKELEELNRVFTFQPEVPRCPLALPDSPASATRSSRGSSTAHLVQ
jgi:tetratricopeptide (TPR) repeat protein